MSDVRYSSGSCIAYTYEIGAHGFLGDSKFKRKIQEGETRSEFRIRRKDDGSGSWD
jgi:hypothetical protein